MKLKASGVIEPDFKIKEGKKKKKDDKSSSMNVQESSMTVSD